MHPNDIITAILDEGFRIHKSIGPGLLESVYKTCLTYKLRQKGLNVDCEKPVPVIFEEVKMDCGFRADMIVENQVVVEIKSIESIADIHVAQTLTYLRFLNIRYGLIVNFNTVLLKAGIRRVICGY